MMINELLNVRERERDGLKERPAVTADIGLLGGDTHRESWSRGG